MRSTRSTRSEWKLKLGLPTYSLVIEWMAKATLLGRRPKYVCLSMFCPSWTLEPALMKIWGVSLSRLRKPRYNYIKCLSKYLECLTFTDRLTESGPAHWFQVHRSCWCDEGETPVLGRYICYLGIICGAFRWCPGSSGDALHGSMDV